MSRLLSLVRRFARAVLAPGRRLRDLGASSYTGAAVLVATTGVAGVSYYGYHQSNNGASIQNLVPEWEYQVAQASGAPAAPRCSGQAPSSHPSYDLPFAGFSYGASNQLVGGFCALAGRPAGSISITIEGRKQGRSDVQDSSSQQADTCVSQGEGSFLLNARVNLCGKLAAFRARGTGSTWQRLCRTCQQNGRYACGSLKCESESYSGSGTGYAGLEFDTNGVEAVRRLGLRGTARGEVGVGLTHSYRDVRAGSCGGGCGSTAICRSDDVGLTLDGIGTLAGSARIANVVYVVAEGQARLQGGMEVTKRTGNCNASAEYCLTGHMTGQINAELRGGGTGGGVSFTVGAIYFECRGVATLSSCGGQGGTQPDPWSCETRTPET